MSAGILAAALEALDLGVAIVAADGSIAHVNPALAMLLECNAAELVGLPWGTISAAALPAEAATQAASCVGHLRRNDGSLLEVLLSARPLGATDGGAARVISCSPLSGERASLQLPLATAAALHRSEAQYRAVVDNASEAVVVTQADVVVFANPSAALVTGYSQEEMRGMTATDLVHPDDVELIAARARARAQGTLTDPYSYFRIVRKDGTLRSVKSCPVKIEWQNGAALLAIVSDLSEREAMEEARRDSEEQLRAVVENVGEGIVVVQDDQVAFANKRAALMAGYSPDEVIGKHVTAIIHPEDIKRILSRDRRRLDGEITGRDRTEYRILRKDGGTMWVQSSPVTISWQGSPATLTFLVDLSERRAAEEALRRSEERYRQVVENGSEGILVLRDDRVLFANSRFAKISGHTLEELLSRSLLTWVHPDDLPMLARRHRARMADQPPEAESVDWRVIRPDGSVVWIRTMGMKISWDGEAANLSFAIDITESRAAEEALRRSEARYRLLVEHVEEGIIVVQDGIIKLCNPAIERIARRPREEILDAPILRFIHPEDQATVLSNYEARLRGEPQRQRYEFRLLSGEGGIVWVEIGAVVFEWEGRPATLSFLIDVTRRRQAEAEIRVALEQQRQLNHLKSRFLSMTSHEFRTPLATILSSAELLRYYGDRLSAGESGELFVSIETAVKRMTQLLSDVLTIGKQDSGTERLVAVQLDVEAFCRSLVDEVLRAERAEGGAPRVVDVRFSGNCANALLDENQLRHILINLLSNALKYTPESRGVRLGVEGLDDEIRFDIEDQGIGIAAEDREHLFELFFRAGNVGNVSGTGLGLAIVKRAVELHRGHISVESELGRGTRFRVSLPRNTVEHA